MAANMRNVTERRDDKIKKKLAHIVETRNIDEGILRKDMESKSTTSRRSTDVSKKNPKDTCTTAEQHDMMDAPKNDVRAIRKKSHEKLIREGMFKDSSQRAEIQKHKASPMMMREQWSHMCSRYGWERSQRDMSKGTRRQQDSSHKAS